MGTDALAACVVAGMAGGDDATFVAAGIVGGAAGVSARGVVGRVVCAGAVREAVFAESEVHKRA